MTIALLTFVALPIGCGHKPNVPESDSANKQKLPFDQQSRANGLSPSRSIVPSATRLPEGTSITVRLRAALSSATAHSGDTFDGITEDPIVVDGQIIVARGTDFVGRVLEAKRSDGKDRGYLRIALVSIQVSGKTVLLDTSSIFSKGGARDGSGSKEMVFPPDRRLTFHLTQAVDLP
ncbi:MAG TPA: hypothetical protein VMI10_06240 [Terriglobales bacterium]|nr:hypothetical protein [Terriglobales bacterium]